MDYLHGYFFNRATPEQLTELANLYGTGLEAITKGSPFRTGLFNEVVPGFKRRAAILGDLVFIFPRRLLTQTAAAVNPDVPSWSYLSSYAHGTPIFGTAHASDLNLFFFEMTDNYAGRSMREYYVNFVHVQDPNLGGKCKYPN